MWLKYIKNVYKQMGDASMGSLLYKKDKDNRPYLDIKLCSTRLQGLLNTGSNISLLGSIGLDPFVQLIN